MIINGNNLNDIWVLTIVLLGGILSLGQPANPDTLECLHAASRRWEEKIPEQGIFS
jgi:hypothetical protein